MTKCENPCPYGKFDGCCHFCPDRGSCADACPEKVDECGQAIFDEEAGLQAFQQSQLATLNAIASLTAHKKAIEDQEKAMKAALYEAMMKFGVKKFESDVLNLTLLTFVDLKQYIETELEKLHSAKIADAQEVLEYLTAVMRGQHTEQVLKLVGDGIQTVTDIDVSAKERIKAAELIGKRYALFSDKMDLGGAVPVVIMGDDQLED